MSISISSVDMFTESNRASTPTALVAEASQAPQAPQAPQAAQLPADIAALQGVKPLPAWFFAFEGVMGGAFDILKADPNAWMVLAGLGLVNLTIGLTVLSKRRKLLKAMLKNGRTRAIAIGLVSLRMGVHLVLGLLGAEITSAAGHLVLAALMAATTVGLLWFDQRVSFRALGLSLDRRG
ncbi:hypothetical protein GCM10009665_14860 [Kitasatospora nipponensis]|uniref:DUF1622 domain-containing protein n=1 Tax=Kitasatospora nipponensis TaxID=258049 RepID=A0ABN1VYC0_9ACTN